MPSEKSILHPFWNRLFKSAWILGLLIILLWGIPRFILVMQANKTGSYNLVSLIFVAMWITPWLFLSTTGRRAMGLRRPSNWQWLLYGFLGSLLLCAVMFVVAVFFYQDTISNWFVYISQSYGNIPNNLTSADKQIYFIIYAIVSMLFSPLGEELLYRGVIHECFAEKWGHRTAAVIDSTAFSLTHLAHFGIVYYSGQWTFLLVPALLWMLFLFFSGLFFSVVRHKSGSILGAVLAHAGFNLAMVYFIFYHIL